MNNTNTTLKEIGLNDKEASLYLASLALGEANMSQLAKKAGLKRSSTYLIFKLLEDKGLMGSYKIRSGLRFVATDPELLVKKSQQKLEDLKLLLPQLTAITQKSESKPKIYFYEGKEGYLNAAEDSLKIPNITVRYIGSLTEIHKIIELDYDLKYYIPNRIKKNIYFRGLLFRSGSETEIQNRNHPAELRELRYLPEKYLHKASTMIYGNKLVILSPKKELITIIIESTEIAESEKKKFDLIWDLVGK